jgi:hypothetical protein
MWRSRRRRFTDTLASLARHPQGHHGWVKVHAALSTVHTQGCCSLERILATTWSIRPHISDAHLVTLLGVAVRQLALCDPTAAAVVYDGTDASTRATLLRNVLDEQEDAINGLLRQHSNSFTGARRFLVPQLIVGGFAACHGVENVRLLDLGTGAGLLPRQLNNRVVFERFSADLRWVPSTPPYLPIPLSGRYGVDLDPLPTLDWVRACYGPSTYYDERLQELLWSLEQTAPAADDAVLLPLDMLNVTELTDFLRQHRINVVTCNFVLFQYDIAVQREIIRCVVKSIDHPGLLLTMDPIQDLKRPGARVTGYLSPEDHPLHLGDVSDAHLMGTVTAGRDLSVVLGDMVDAHER